MGTSVAKVLEGGGEVGAGVAYALASLGIMLSNKIVLSSYGFPSANVLCVLQCVVTVAVLLAPNGGGAGDGGPSVSLPSSLSWSCLPVWRRRRLVPPWREVKAGVGEFVGVARGLFPLQILFCVNASSGLGSTRRLSVPMMACLRRFSIVMTMVGEWVWLQRTFSSRVVASVAVMVAGAAVAALDDLAFDAAGYALVGINNLATASFAVITGLRMAGSQGQGGEPGGQRDQSRGGSQSSSTLMLHNSVFCLLALPVAMAATGELSTAVAGLASFPAWTDPLFLASFTLSVGAGVIFNLSLLACINANGPTTTAVIGLLKNVVGTFIGMLPFLPGYHYSPLNFLGVSMSMAGGVAYGAAKLGGGKQPESVPSLPEAGGGVDAVGKAGRDESPTTVLAEIKVLDEGPAALGAADGPVGKAQ